MRLRGNDGGVGGWLCRDEGGVGEQLSGDNGICRLRGERSAVMACAQVRLSALVGISSAQSKTPDIVGYPGFWYSA